MLINCPQLPNFVKILKQNISVALKQMDFGFFPKTSCRRVYTRQVLMYELVFMTVHVESYLSKPGIYFQSVLHDLERQ